MAGKICFKITASGVQFGHSEIIVTEKECVIERGGYASVFQSERCVIEVLLMNRSWKCCTSKKVRVQLGIKVKCQNWKQKNETTNLNNS